MSELLSTLQRVETLEGRKPIYKDAHITTQKINPNELSPIALYVLNGNLRRIARMMADVQAHVGLDLLAHPELYMDDTYTVAPPIVEESDNKLCIVDGLHRCTYAQDQGKDIMIARVSGVDPSVPLISLPVEWEEVARVDIRPRSVENVRRMRPGIPNDDVEIRKYYRDYSELGSSGRRQHIK